MSSGERPIGAAKGKQSDTEALCQPPPPVHPPLVHPPLVGGGGRHLAHEQYEINRKSHAPKPLRNNFSWALLCTLDFVHPRHSAVPCTMLNTSVFRNFSYGC